MLGPARTKHSDINNAASCYHCLVLFSGRRTMRKLQIEDAEIMRIAIQQEIGRSEESRYDHRLHGLLLVTAGQSCREVADLFGEDGTTVQRWVRRFEQGGLDALREGERSGRPRTLEPRDWRRLQGGLGKTPPELRPAATLWDGPVIAAHLPPPDAGDLRVRPRP